MAGDVGPPFRSGFRDMAEPAFSFVAQQDGLATREQLLDDGYTWAFVRSQVEGRRWRDLNERVVVTHNGPLTWLQKLWAVYLSAQPPATMCGLTALQQWGITGFESEVIHIVVRRGARVLPVEGVQVDVHESRRFTKANIVYARTPPSTRLARAAVDAAAWSQNLHHAFRVFVAPVQQRRELAGELLDELIAAGAIRHRQPLLALANDMCGGAQALSEVEFLRFCRRHHLPRPNCQRRMDFAGRWRYLDATFVLPDGRIVRVEIDGGVHLNLSVKAEDALKDNAANIDGRLVLRFASISIYLDDPRAVSQLRRALGVVSTS